MSETLGIVWIVLGTVAVTLLAVITGVLVVTLLDARRTLRTARETLDRVTPAAEETLGNVRDVSGAASRAVSSIASVSSQVSSRMPREGGPSVPAWVSIGVAAIGAISALGALRRRGKGGRKTASAASTPESDN